MAKLTVEVSAEDFKAAIKKAYNKTKNRFAIPGFRKGQGFSGCDREDVR